MPRTSILRWSALTFVAVAFGYLLVSAPQRALGQDTGTISTTPTATPSAAPSATPTPPPMPNAPQSCC